MKMSKRVMGRRVFETERAMDKFAALQMIVDERSFAIIDGVAVDLSSAARVLAVYERLNAENQQRLANMPIQKMVEVSWKVTSR